MDQSAIPGGALTRPQVSRKGRDLAVVMTAVRAGTICDARTGPIAALVGPQCFPVHRAGD